MPTVRRPQGQRPGVSLVEALTSVTITTMAGAALLTSLGATVRTGTEAAQKAVARGLAAQLMDEIAAVRFPDDQHDRRSRNARPRKDRGTFDDLDDYDGWSASPPRDRRGRILGTEGFVQNGVEFARPEPMRPDPGFLANFTREVVVEPVEPDGKSGWRRVSGSHRFRRVQVRVLYTDGRQNTKTLARTSRIFSHVPGTP